MTCISGETVNGKSTFNTVTDKSGLQIGAKTTWLAGAVR
jgi:hypothetical protein